MSCRGFYRCLLVVCLLWGLCGPCVPTARADCPLYPLPTSRFGVDLNPSFGRITDYDVGALHIGWYSDWAASLEPLRPGGIEYIQLIAVKYGDWSIWSIHGAWADRWTMLRDIISLNPGAMWMIGNEPECPYDPGGGSNTPQQYAAVYHDLYEYIKLQDPTAQIAIGGIVEPTPLRLEWLDQLLAYYQTTYNEPMPVDVWTTHLLILPEMSPLCPDEICGETRWGAGVPVGLPNAYGELYTMVQTWDVSIFQQLVRAFRDWMSRNDQRDKPLWITEYGVLLAEAHGATPQVVNAFMNATFDYMLSARDASLGYPADSNLLVQRWAWNSLNDQPPNFETGQGFNGGLFDYRDNTFPGTPTAFGLNFMAYTNSLLAGSACISGTVHLEGRPTIPDSSQVTTGTLTLLRVDCPRPEPDIRSVTTNDSGVFTLCNVPAGTYDIVVKGYNTLANRTNAVVLPAGSTSVDLGLLPSGDANNDNLVTILDFSMLVATYGSVRGDLTYDHRADFDGNGRVNILDFSLLATHFGEIGAPQSP